MSIPPVFNGRLYSDSVVGLKNEPQHRAVIWLLCHYPNTEEAGERIRVASALHRAIGLPIWLFGSATARYPASVESLLKKKLLEAGIPPEAVVCSADQDDIPDSLDTVQEIANVFEMASRRSVAALICVSNRLQLLQVRGLLRNKPIQLAFVPIPLRDWRCWYVMGRLILIPLAFLGIGQHFLPLVLVRRARAKLAAWPF